MTQVTWIKQVHMSGLLGQLIDMMMYTDIDFE